jgi:hypothetical protein
LTSSPLTRCIKGCHRSHPRRCIWTQPCESPSTVCHWRGTYASDTYFLMNSYDEVLIIIILFCFSGCRPHWPNTKTKPRLEVRYFTTSKGSLNTWTDFSVG